MESCKITTLQLWIHTRSGPALVSRAVRRAGLLATDGTIRTGIYQASFQGTGIELLTPGAAGQGAVMDMIYAGVKAGNMAYDEIGRAHV